MVRLPTVRHPVRLLAGIVAVVLVVALFGSTCSAPDRRTLPPPSSTSSTQLEATTTTVDRSRTVLQPVAGRTTTTLVEFGDAILSGVVSGPDGAVPGAVVRVERLVRDAVQVREARTGPDGTWALEGIPGGRMRVRAFAPPTLTMLEPEIFFLTDGEQRDLRLVVREHEGILVLSDVSPGAPTVGSTVNVVLRVVQKVVDEQGVARTLPIAGLEVQVESSGWELVDGGGVTDGDGEALFTFRCEQASTVFATAVLFDGVEERRYPLEVPSCGPRPTTTTSTSTTSTTEPDDDTTAPTSSTTTTTEDG